MHWSLEQVRELDVDEYVELIEWAQTRHEKDSDSMDMDEVIAAKNAKQAGEGAE